MWRYAGGWGALVIGHHARMNERVIGRHVIGARLAFSFRFVCVCVKEKRGAEPWRGPRLCLGERPQQGETVPHCQVIWQKFFFFPLSATSC